MNRIWKRKTLSNKNTNEKDYTNPDKTERRHFEKTLRERKSILIIIKANI